MSTINVDNIAEYTSSGKINATHDIKMASGKSILNSDGYSTGAMVKLASSTASNDDAIIFDNFVDHNTYISYFIVMKNLHPQTNNVELRLKFRVGGASGSNGSRNVLISLNACPVLPSLILSLVSSIFLITKGNRVSIEVIPYTVAEAYVFCSSCLVFLRSCSIPIETCKRSSFTCSSIC